VYAYYADAHLHATDALTFYILGFVLLCIASFAFFFGRTVLREGFFPFAFFFLFVPLPSFLLEPVISLLQRGSAEIAAATFGIFGVPALREGLVFHLTRVSIEVAPECSGIRSSMALLVLALLVAHFAFRPFWKKTVFVIAGLLMMFIKNGVRIATLTLLANYVNPQFLYGDLHRQGGFVFFLLGLLLLLPVYWLLQRGESVLATGAGPAKLGSQREAV
jgi:exosortase